MKLGRTAPYVLRFAVTVLTPLCYRQSFALGLYEDATDKN